MTTYAHIIIKDNKVICSYLNNEENGDDLTQAHPAGSTCTTVVHKEDTITYELVDGEIAEVSQEDMYSRMNDADNTDVTIPG
tara:strand:- start:910 stop:1155 length:246 start_codon:yes stop_codon:yes gene_type:complete